MKHTKLPCYPASKQPNPTTYGSAANQAEWQGNIATLRQGDKLPSFGSDNAFDTVAENRFTYGKAKPKAWDYDGKPPQLPTHKIERQDKRESGKHIFAFSPAIKQPCYPIAKQSGGIVAVSQGDRVTKRFRVIKTDAITKEETSFLVTLVTNTISILSYGQIFEFSHSSRAKGTFCDSRDGKRHPLSFAKAELRRILGATDGDTKYQELVTFPSKRPAALLPRNGGTPSQGSRVAG